MYLNKSIYREEFQLITVYYSKRIKKTRNN